MGLTFKIAFRNLFRHLGKSLVIGTILFVGAMFMSIGNGIIAGTENGIEENIIKHFKTWAQKNNIAIPEFDPEKSGDNSYVDDLPI